jgi:hypothetical protein
MAKKKKSSAWMWLIGIPVIVFRDLILYEPGRAKGKRRRRW